MYLFIFFNKMQVYNQKWPNQIRNECKLKPLALLFGHYYEFCSHLFKTTYTCGVCNSRCDRSTTVSSHTQHDWK